VVGVGKVETVGTGVGCVRQESRAGRTNRMIERRRKVTSTRRNRSKNAWVCIETQLYHRCVHTSRYFYVHIRGVESPALADIEEGNAAACSGSWEEESDGAYSSFHAVVVTALKEGKAKPAGSTLETLEVGPRCGLR
jgi:hypothetical protein